MLFPDFWWFKADESPKIRLSGDCLSDIESAVSERNPELARKLRMCTRGDGRRIVISLNPDGTFEEV